MDNDKTETSESIAQTIKPQPISSSFSQRPTLPITKTINKPVKSNTRRNLHYLIVCLVLFIIVEFIFGLHNAKSKDIANPSVTYNIPPIIIPPDSIPDAASSININVPKPPASIDQAIKPMPKYMIKSKDKDYGI